MKIDFLYILKIGICEFHRKIANAIAPAVHPNIQIAKYSCRKDDDTASDVEDDWIISDDFTLCMDVIPKLFAVLKLPLDDVIEPVMLLLFVDTPDRFGVRYTDDSEARVADASSLTASSVIVAVPSKMFPDGSMLKIWLPIVTI